MSSSRFLKPVNQQILEKHVESRLKKRVEAIGGKYRKFVSPGLRGAQDRICIFPTGIVVFVEVKRPGKHPTAVQQKRINEMLTLGALSLYVNSYDTVELFISQIQEAINARLLGDTTAGIIIRPGKA